MGLGLRSRICRLLCWRRKTWRRLRVTFALLFDWEVAKALLGVVLEGRYVYIRAAAFAHVSFLYRLSSQPCNMYFHVEREIARRRYSGTGTTECVDMKICPKVPW